MVPLVAALGLMAGTIWLVNAALYANPIVWVIGLIVGLAAGLYLAYQKSESFRQVVGVVGDVLGRVFQPGIEAIEILWGWLQKAIDLARDVQAAVGWAMDKFFGAPGGVTVTAEDNRGTGLFGAPDGSQWAPIRGAAMSSLTGGTSPSSGQGPSGQIVNVTVNGALDPQAVADQIAGLLRRRSSNRGLTPTVAL